MLRTGSPWTTYRVPDDLADDSEESIVGTEWHQEAISDLAEKLVEAGRRQQASWGVCSQIALIGLRHADGRPYDPRPDVLVLTRPLPAGWLSTIALADAGAPLFIAEVASASTVRGDLGEKRLAYEAIGVESYLVFDPEGSLLPEPVLAWRLEHGRYVPWTAAEDGWWHSERLNLSFRPAGPGPLLEVRDAHAVRIPSAREAHRSLEEYAALLVEQQRRLVEQDRRLAEEQRLRETLEEELRRLRRETS
jgi:Uma2 family endonuclease